MDVTANICPSCHRPLPADAPLCPVCALLGARDEPLPSGVPPLEEIQSAFPELELLECIGRGGMGIVYKARQPHLDRLVALKILAPELSADPGFAERFSREARTLAKLSHSHIVGIHDYGHRDGFYFLAMEYIDGVNLRQAMRAARFTPEQALLLIPDLCGALQFAHDHGVLHRDIKPENILIDTRGRVKLADFGIAQLLGEGPSHLTLTATGSALGSAAYMAPEQIEASGEIDHRADIYSLGVVFYEMLTGGLPLGRFPLPSEKSTASAGIDDVVLRALEKERERRYQSADAVRSGIDGASAYKHPASPGRTSDPADQQRRITLWSLGLSGGGFIGAMVGLITSPVILGFGAVAFIIGMIGCWWLLIGMRSGRYQPVHRGLLLGAAFVPALAGVVGGIAVAPVKNFPDAIYSGQPWPLWILVPFAITVLLGKLLWKLMALRPGTEPSPSLRRFRRWAPVLGTAALLLCLVTGKHLKEQLNPLSKYYSASFLFRDAKTYAVLSETDRVLVEEAVARAAGEYAGLYQIEFPPYRPNTLSIGFSDRAFLWSKNSEEHLSSFVQRLRASLPTRIRMEFAGQGVWADDVGSLLTRMQTNGTHAIALLLGAGTILIIFAGKRAFVISLALGTIATVILQTLPAWPTPSILPPALGDHPPLPPLAALDTDYSTFTSTIDSAIRAATRKDATAFLETFDTASLGAGQTARLPELINLFAATTSGRPASHDNASTEVIVELTAHYEDPNWDGDCARSFELPLISTKDGWRIGGEKLPGVVDELLEWSRELKFSLRFVK